MDLSVALTLALNECKLRKSSERKGTRKDFAIKVGVAASTLSQWLAGESSPTADNLQKIVAELRLYGDDIAKDFIYNVFYIEVRFDGRTPLPMSQALSQCMNERGMTSYAVGEKSAATRTSVVDWRSGKTQPKLLNLKRLIALFGGVLLCRLLGCSEV
jgi:transcriptional regulator with XRE-family HTH domain